MYKFQFGFIAALLRYIGAYWKSTCFARLILKKRKRLLKIYLICFRKRLLKISLISMNKRLKKWLTSLKKVEWSCGATSCHLKMNPNLSELNQECLVCITTKSWSLTKSSTGSTPKCLQNIARSIFNSELKLKTVYYQ